jgi:uncharacterized protein
MILMDVKKAIGRVLCLLLLALGSASLGSAQSTAQLAPNAPSSGADYEIVSERDVMVAMRDGVRLATDIHRPARAGASSVLRFPTILLRTPYNKTSRDATVVKSFVPRGYVVVVQDVRGRYQSEGHWTPLRDDPKDGFDTAEWIGRQPRSNERIGTVGTSYEGATQHALAIGGAPYVQAMIPRNAMSDFGTYGVRTTSRAGMTRGARRSPT